MKTRLNLPGAALALALFSSLNLQLSPAIAQGSLTPPGAPAPMMRSLDQIEPRTPISSAPFIITQPGSYYLTTNLTVSGGNAIVIAASGVTLDLNGFTISSTAASATGDGILINSGDSTARNITIANGFIQGGVTNNGSGVYSGSGFGNGITCLNNPPVNVLISRVSVTGCLYDGIFLSSVGSLVVESCTVTTVGSFGIFASIVKESSAVDCGAEAIFGNEVSDCRGQSSGSGNGIYATTALNCYGYSFGDGTGVYAGNAQNCFGGSAGSGDGVNAGDTAENCCGSANSIGDGVSAITALNCCGFSGSYGIYSATALNCYGYSYSSGSGIYANYIANSCYGYSYSGTGVSAFIASLCHGDTSIGTALSTAHNVNSY